VPWHDPLIGMTITHQEAPMTGSDNAALAQDLYALFNEGRLDEASKLGSDDITVDVVPFGMVFDGQDGLLGFMSGFKSAFPDLTITVEHQVASDKGVVSECSWAGTHDGTLTTPAGPVAPTGKRVEGARFCEVWDVDDGSITRLVNYQDVSTWLRQLDLA
jgi:steroid delta-isomerase-like uncharacterized protein